MISAERIAEIESLLGGGNYGAAIHVLQELLAADPGDPLLLNKLAHAHLRKGELRQANKCFYAAGSALEGALIPIYSGRAEVETRLEHGVEAAFWARKAIALRHQQTMQRSSLFRQPVWKASKSIGKPLISFSLYGKNPLYGEGAVLNAELAAQYFPQFICRIYHDDSVAKGVLKLLRNRGCQTVRVTSEQERWHPTMWRFLALEDEEVPVVLLRDADSPLGERERRMVTRWLESDFDFHVIRDWYSHTPLILAGLFGRKGGFFQNLSDSVAGYLEKKGSRWGVDQEFLGDVIWPLLQGDLLIHDPPHRESGDPCDSGLGAAKHVNQHVGCSFPLQTLSSDLSYEEGTDVQWSLSEGDHHDGEGERLYPPIADDEGMMAIRLPLMLVQKIQSHQVRLSLNRSKP